MDFKQIQELIKLVNKTNISEVKIEEKDFKITLRSKSYTEAIQKSDAPTQLPISIQSGSPVVGTPMPAPVAQAAAEAPAAAPNSAADKEAESDANSGLVEIKSPMIGTFYRSSSPDKPPFVKVGDVIEKGSVICIVEAMKLFNEIEAEISGKIVKVLVDNSSPVEYDQPIFLVDPN